MQIQIIAECVKSSFFKKKKHSMTQIASVANTQAANSAGHMAQTSTGGHQVVLWGRVGGPAQSYVGFLCKQAKFCARATALCFVWVVGEGAPAMPGSTGGGG